MAMTATTENTTPLATLVSEVNAHLKKAAESEMKTALSKEETEQHYRNAGLLLKQLKERKTADTTWPEYVREHFDLSQERADELIRIASDRTTVEEVRAGTADRMRRHRAKNKRVSRDTGSQSASSPKGGRSRRSGACDVDWHSDPPLDDYDSPVEGYQAQAKIYAHEALQDAKAFPMLRRDVPPSAITDEILQRVQEAAAAWTGLLTKLEQRKRAEPAPETRSAGELVRVHMTGKRAVTGETVVAVQEAKPADGITPVFVAATTKPLVDGVAPVFERYRRRQGRSS
jgi:hypothetical protein